MEPLLNNCKSRRAFVTYRPIAAILAAGLVACAFCGQANAASTEWQDLGGGKARLVAVKDPATDLIEGMIEVKLDEGWKTYWRSPGGSGIPPEFDFSASRNFSAGDVAFPVPEWIKIPSSAFAGYKGEVRFVFDGKANAMDSEIRLDVLIGVCEEICIPATAGFTLTADQLNSSDPRAAVEVAMAKSDLPATATSDNEPVHPVSYVANTLLVKVNAEPGTAPPVLYLEGPELWNLPNPKLVGSGDGGHTFELKIPPSVTPEMTAQSPLRYTVVTVGEGAYRSGIEGYFEFPQ